MNALARYSRWRIGLVCTILLAMLLPGCGRQPGDSAATQLRQSVRDLGKSLTSTLEQSPHLSEDDLRSYLRYHAPSAFWIDLPDLPGIMRFGLALDAVEETGGGLSYRQTRVRICAQYERKPPDLSFSLSDTPCPNDLEARGAQRADRVVTVQQSWWRGE